MDYFTVYDLVGLVGVSFIIISYFFLQIGRISPTNSLYSIANIIGSTLILVSLYHEFNLPSAVIESFWILISLIGLFRSRNNKQSGS